MNYSHNYYKLSNCVYTTIRKSKESYQKSGFIESEYLTEHIKTFQTFEFKHDAIILRIESVILDDLPESVLIMDCLFPKSSINSRLKCYELIQSFYTSKIDFSKQKFYLFLLMKIKPIKNKKSNRDVKWATRLAKRLKRKRKKNKGII